MLDGRDYSNFGHKPMTTRRGLVRPFIYGPIMLGIMFAGIYIDYEE